MSSDTSVLNNTSLEARCHVVDGINMALDMTTRMANEYQDLDVAVVLELAAIARKRRGKQRTREAAPADRYILPSPPQSGQFLFPFFFFIFSSRFSSKTMANNPMT